MPRNVVLHVGLAKTASTSIQNSLAADPGLEAQGARVPDFRLGPHAVLNHSLHLSMLFDENAPDHHIVRQRNLNLETERTLAMQALREAVDGEGTLILSAEEIPFWADASQKLLRRWFDEQNIPLRVLAFVRPVVSLMDSLTQQIVKDGSTIAPQRGASPARLLPQLRENFPQIELYDYREAAVYEGGAVAAFYAILGLRPGVDVRAERDNVSLGDPGARLGGRINEILPPVVEGRPNPLRRFSDLNWLSDIAGPRFRLRDTEIPADWLREQVDSLVAQTSPAFAEDLSHLSQPVAPWTDEQIAAALAGMEGANPAMRAAALLALTQLPGVSTDQLAGIVARLRGG